MRWRSFGMGWELVGYQQSAQDVVQGAMFEEAAAAGGKGNGGGCGGMVVVRNIELYALCEGCLLPFRLHCHVAYIPSRERVVGLSKLARVAEIYAKRLQSPQRFVDELVQAFADTLKPLGVAVVAESWHLQWPDAFESRITGKGKETVGWTKSAVCARRGQFQDKAGDLLWNEFMGILALEGTSVMDSCSVDAESPDHGCPFSLFDAHFLSSIGSLDLLPSKPVSNGCAEPQSRGNGCLECSGISGDIDAVTTRIPEMIEAVQNLLRLVGDDPCRAQVRMTPWRFVGWLWTSTQGSRFPVPALDLELRSSPHGSAGTNGITQLGAAHVGTNGSSEGISGELDLSFFSQCEHHLLPFLGVVHVGYMVGRGERRIDRMSIQRVVQKYSSRLQVQERLTRQIAEAVGGSVMVVVEAKHMCMLSRGVQQHASYTVTHANLGAFSTDVSARTTFLQLVVQRGVVKKMAQPPVKLIHDKYSKALDLHEEMISQFEEAMKCKPELKSCLSRVYDNLDPVRVLGLFESMVEQDCEVLDLAERPEKLIITHLIVPPVAIRPSVEMDGAAGSNEDDLTMRLMVILSCNNSLRTCVESGLPAERTMETWDLLQSQVSLYINSETPVARTEQQTSGKPLRGFVQHLKGKQGRFRGNLSGKRVDFTGRTVISPDPNLKITEVAVPLLMAQVLTYPEKVSRYNIDRRKGSIDALMLGSIDTLLKNLLS